MFYTIIFLLSFFPVPVDYTLKLSHGTIMNRDETIHIDAFCIYYVVRRKENGLLIYPVWVKPFDYHKYLSTSILN